MIFVGKDGQSYSLGCGYCGQLGLVDNVDRKIPILVPLNNVVQSSIDNDQSRWLRSDGLVYECGYISHGKSINYPRVIPDVTNIVSIST